MSRTRKQYNEWCSCCGKFVNPKEFENEVMPIDNIDTEGSVCSRCYYEQAMDNWFQIRNMVDLVYSALKSPIKKFVFKHRPIEEQFAICNKLIKKGILTWKIG